MTMPAPQLFIGMPIYQLGEECSTKGLVRALQKGDVPAMRTAATVLQRYPWLGSTSSRALFFQ